jgi:hypothetical protein
LLLLTLILLLVTLMNRLRGALGRAGRSREQGNLKFAERFSTECNEQ